MKPADEIERTVKHVSFKAGPAMDEELWADIAQAGDFGPAKSAPDRKNIGRFIMTMSSTRIVIAALICVGLGVGAVVGVTVGRYYMDMGKDDSGLHHFISADGTSVIATGANDAVDVEQAASDLEEIKTLSDQGRKEVLRVEELTANGLLESRILVHAYKLSDGRTADMRDGAGGKHALTETQWQEWLQRRDAGPGENRGSYEEQVSGRTLVFHRQRYVLSDGTELIWSVGEPKSGQ
jgi:hypothetical protein